MASVQTEAEKRLTLAKRLKPKGIDFRPQLWLGVIQALLSRSDRRLAP